MNEETFRLLFFEHKSLNRKLQLYILYTGNAQQILMWPYNYTK